MAARALAAGADQALALADRHRAVLRRGGDQGADGGAIDDSCSLIALI